MLSAAAQFALKHEEATALVRAHAPERLRDALIQALRPAIALSARRMDDAQIPVGASKFGGAPDVPAGFEWPMWDGRPLGFLAQISLAQIAPLDTQDLLPRTGLLLFFIGYDEEQGAYAHAGRQGSWRVLWFEAVDLERTEAARQSSWGAASIEAGAAWSFPAEVAPDFDFADYAEEEQWLDYLDEIHLGHHALGYADAIQELPSIECETARRGLHLGSWEASREQAAIERGAEDWHLLLQVNSDDEFNASWGDWGRLFFMMRGQDLARQDFSQAGFCLQSH